MECTEGGTSADNGRPACGREAKTVLASTRITSARPVVLDGAIGIVELFLSRNWGILKFYPQRMRS